MKIEIRIQMRSGQVFKTEVPEEKLLDCYKATKVEFKDTFVLGAIDSSKDPTFIINGAYVESITLTEKQE